MKKYYLVLMALFTLALPAFAEGEAPLLSGETQAFTDSKNGFSVTLPKELTGGEVGSPAMSFSGPLADGGSLSFHVNTIAMPSVPSETMYNMNMDHTKKNPQYTDVQAIKVPGGMGYWYKETGKEADGTAKKSDSIHRWHLAAYGKGKMFNVVLGGAYATFQKPAIIAAYKKVIQSFKIL